MKQLLCCSYTGSFNGFLTIACIHACMYVGLCMYVCINVQCMYISVYVCIMHAYMCVYACIIHTYMMHVCTQ